MTQNSPQLFIYPDGRMDRKNAAAYLGLAEKTLAMYASRGEGPAYVKRGKVFYFKTDLDEWLNKGRVHSASQALIKD